MKFVFTSYIFTKEYTDPAAWIDRIKAYTGILEALSKNNAVISIEQIDYEGEYAKDDVKYCFKRYSKLGRLFPFGMHRFIKAQRPDVVVIQSLRFPLQILQLRLKLGRKVKIMVQNHAERPFRGIKGYLQKLANKYIDAYLFAAKDLGMEWVKAGGLISAEKIHEVMEISSVFKPMDKNIARTKTGAEGSPVFLWVGRLNDNKDPLTVVKAFLQYAAQNPQARLYMIYHTEELLPQILQLLDSSKQKDSITMVGKLLHDELQYWFSSSDIILSGSHYEGSGTAIAEAMSCGCMPIVTDIFSFRMITDNGQCGILYDPGNEAALLAALLKASQMDIPEKQKRSVEYFRSNLSFEAIAGRFQDIAASL